MASSFVQYPPARVVLQLRRHIKAGGVIAYPTESCYGLGCDPSNIKAIKRILKLKHRPAHKGLIVIAAHLDQLRPWLARLTATEETKLNQVWPAPVTFLLPASRRVHPLLRGQYNKLAVRVPAHSIAAGLCRVLGTPLVSTSANLMGRRPIKTSRECKRIFGSRIKIVPGKIGHNKRPSTIIDFSSAQIVR